MAIGLAGLDVVEEATRKVVEPLTAEDGSIAFDTNVFIYVVGQARNFVSRPLPERGAHRPETAPTRVIT